MTLNQAVKLELQELKKLGVHVPGQLLKDIDTLDLSEYDNMSGTELTDLLIGLYL